MPRGSWFWVLAVLLSFGVGSALYELVPVMPRWRLHGSGRGFRPADDGATLWTWD